VLNRLSKVKKPVYCATSKSAEMGISVSELSGLRDRYDLFLKEKKMAGAGPTTRSDSKQMNRNAYIKSINENFNSLIKEQSAKKWGYLLIQLVRYRIELYTENAKNESTFGDALRAVHISLLQALKLAYEKRKECVILKKINEEIEWAPTMLASCLEIDVPTLEETRIYAAAYGYEDALKEISFDSKPKRKHSLFRLSKETLLTVYPAGLTAFSDQLDDFCKQLSSERYESYLGYNNFFKIDDEQQEQNPLPKKARINNQDL